MKYLYSILTLFFFVSTGFSQSHWTKSNVSEIEKFRSGDRLINPLKYEVFTLDLEALYRDLEKAPKELVGLRGEKELIIDVPHPNGEIVKYKVWKAKVMEDGLAKKFPQLGSFAGQSLNKKHNIRFSTGDVGFHAAITSNEGKIYIDPIFLDNPSIYQTYYIKDQEIPADYNSFCGYQDTAELIQDGYKPSSTISRGNVPQMLTVFRFALACTGEYAEIVGGTKDAVMERFNIAMTRLNEVYERDVAVRHVLIEDNDLLIHLDKNNDPYFVPPFNPSLDFGENGIGITLLGQNTGVVNSIIPSNSYDIGHLFTRNCDDVGGVASGANACRNDKAGGISCIGGANTGNFAASTMAHEVGHQLSAGHSWSNCPPAQEQLSVGNAYEPGSGSTIMSYSGACGADNNVGADDDYFSAGSIFNIMDYYLDGSGDCSEEIDLGNHRPEISWPYTDGFYIPLFTPFELEASAIDKDGDNLTYGWDQYNLGPISQLGTPVGNAPSFRSYPPTDDPKRVFPRLQTILSGSSNRTEVLPGYERDLNFRFVVRDNYPGGGSIIWEEVAFHTAPGTGPFFIETQNFDTPDYTVGQEVLITWDVANTDETPINCERVDIFVSDNNGNDFNYPVKISTPNDGEEIINIPNAVSLNARIKIKASENIFFDINNDAFIIDEATEPVYFYTLSESYFNNICSPANLNLEVDASAFGGYTDALEFSIANDLPDGMTANFSETTIDPNGEIQIAFDIEDDITTGIYELELQAISGTDTSTQIITFEVISSLFDDLALMSPAQSSVGVEQLPTFTWTEARNAQEYIFELSDNPAFGATNIAYQEGIEGTSYVPELALDVSTLYYWRVTPINDCTLGKSTDINIFSTIALSCRDLLSDDLPKNITQGPPSDVFSTVSIFDEGEVEGISVKKVKGLHERLSNLTFSVISPSGTEVVLVSNKCLNAQNFNCSFSDASPQEIDCPFNKNYMPEEPLAAFIGEPLMGDWTLNINDATAGAGGQFQEFTLQICSNAALNTPYIVNNNTLEVPTGMANRLTTEVLLTEDDDNTAEELIYTIITMPLYGTMQVSGMEAAVGTQFTQADIQSGKVRYMNTDTSVDSDSFSFTVIDGKGGWIDITEFDFAMGDDFMSSVEDLSDLLLVDIIPNPTSDLSIVNINNTLGLEYSFQLLSMSGQVITQQRLKGDQQIEIDATQIPSGVYLLSIESERFVKNMKLSVTK